MLLGGDDTTVMRVNCCEGFIFIRYWRRTSRPLFPTTIYVMMSVQINLYETQSNTVANAFFPRRGGSANVKVGWPVYYYVQFFPQKRRKKLDEEAAAWVLGAPSWICQCNMTFTMFYLWCFMYFFAKILFLFKFIILQLWMEHCIDNCF